ncbi:hypothetical protein [Vreelandella alkaliphila]|uniref:Uncharacterized protein n=1 Tax=Vreelandella alkaliphila TaxID=272774 RepID=A0AAJ2VSP8_9GAMM|nr:hypothetical protein [Halomonas alkaliphila]MDX5979650.1 hypothetical protein [Halomonas alkaliphila]
MTPLELLDDVKARFPLLLVQDQGQLQRLLRIALQAYQDKAGHICVLRLKASDLPPDTPTLQPPTGALAPIGGEDARGSAVFLQELSGDSPAWLLELTPCHIPPYTVRYFFDFVGMRYDQDHLPRGTTGLIGDYLYTLIDIINTQRQRQVNQASEIPYDHLRSDAELHQAKTEMELTIQEQAAIIPPVIAA